MIHIESGIVQGSYHSNDWNLDSGYGQRKWTKVIQFEEEFTEPPEIFLSISSFHFIKESDFRLSISKEDVTESQFKLSISTWNDTMIKRASAIWMAYDASKAKQQGTLIQSGLARMHKDDENYSLFTGNGPRSKMVRIHFPIEFSDKPNVIVGFTMIDHIIDGNDVRIKCDHKYEDKIGFDIELSTWKDSCIWSSEMNWISFDPSFKNSDTYQIITRKDHLDRAHNPHFSLSHGHGKRESRIMKIYPRRFLRRPNLIAFPNAFSLLTSYHPKVGNRDGIIETLAINQIESSFELGLCTYSSSIIESSEISWISTGIPGPRLQGNVIGPHSPIQSNNHYMHNPYHNQNLLNNVNNMFIIPSNPIQNQQNNNNDQEDEGQQNNDQNVVVNNPQQEENQPNEENNQNECKICYDSKVDTVFIPCGHMCACHACAVNVLTKFQKQCPICKTVVSNVVKTYIV